jgi:hypothetical protein
MAEGRLLHGMDSSPGSDTAPNCLHKVMTRRPLLGEADAGERGVLAIREDGGAAGARDDGSVCRPCRASLQGARTCELQIGKGERERGGHGAWVR